MKMDDKYNCLAVSDLHGNLKLYKTLFTVIESEKPEAVFIAGDITGGYFRTRLGENLEDFILEFLQNNLMQLRERLADAYPDIFVILGNDDPGYLEDACRLLDKKGLWHYAHNNCLKWKSYYVCGYSYVPPTPFQMKDWEKFDVSRYVDVGAISPSAGFRTVEASTLEQEWGTIKRDLEQLFTATDLSRYICLFHSPPYKTLLDRAALDGKMIDHAPLDVHIGSIAIREFITKRQPLTTIHGHVHESTSITGSWSDCIGETIMFNAAHDKPELAIIRFNSENPQECNRQIM
jgi:uncharacterized protein